ncbi:hypothetical protein CfE428DRAFT_1811 [Chthoniobacter flavus Ellin428]|uniref:Tfp pilus assembly protein PilX n=1 Tax=Chthoniobacter flavus Ellin428 TaxID=497964 RepID=B4CYS3_9BACT|nr:hypothetical protein [Chthoniobacter flavus]EDY20614.1 hypothetical protein CfE428DRAFT_1811 [Chthoniobacter flavus Ellin428]TCO89879.1 hypothetical protein EV701_11251 [Chthoniobacter flavus]
MSMQRSAPSVRHHSGIALVIVLAFLVLLLGLVVAFLSRAVTERQVSNSSASQTKVDLFAQGAVETLIGDLKQEIAAGSKAPAATPSPAPNTDLYFPKTNATVVPYRVGLPATDQALPNLVKRSSYQQPFYAGADYDTGNYPASNRAANVSTTTLSQNFRSWSTARWNKALLLPKQDPTSDTDFTPATGANGYTAPDWILVARDGSNPTAWNAALASAAGNSFVVGRYAYNIYDEGGLLDMNVAGFPTGVTAAQAGGKSALAFADLTQLKDTTGSSLFTQAQIDAFIAWRNYATTQAPADFPTPAFTTASGLNYFKAVTANTKGFLTTSNTTLYNNQSDRMLAGRQQLMKLLLSGIASQDAAAKKERANLQNALQYLGTFSRDLNQPSYIPAVQTDPAAPVVLAANLGGNNAFGGDKFINPSFPAVRVPTSFTRNDKSTAKAGDPLVNQRFALQRLAWITYKGPSATRAQGDPDIQVLINNGIPWSYLQLGTAASIQKYFGLTWDGANNRWQYDIHNGGNTGTGIIMLVGRPAGTVANAAKYVQDANREPDFFELLKAGITVGSLGKAAVSSATAVNNASYIPPGYFGPQVPANLRYNFDTSVDYHIIQIGANILSAVNPTSYPMRITFDDGSARGAWEFQGVTDLPYLSYVFNGVLRTKAPISTPPVNYGNYADPNPFQYPRPVAKKIPTDPDPTITDPGKAYAIQVPAVWNPYDPNGTQSVLRPSNFRVVIDSNDPVSLANGSPNEKVWCAAQATTKTTGTAGTNQGLGISPGDFSYNASTNPTSTTGSPVSDSVTFTDTTSNGSLFREPTLIFRTSYTGGSASRTAGNVTSIDANPLPTGNPNLDPAGTPFAPLVLGSFPLAFKQNNNPDVLCTGTAVIGHGSTTAAGNNRVYFTYRLQYQDPNNVSNWITYDTKYARTTQGLFSYQSRGGFSPCVIKGPNGFSPFSWAAAIDPRSARFGMMMGIMNYGRSLMYTAASPPDNGGANGWAYDSGGSSAIPQGITYPIRPDFSAGFYFADVDRGDLPPGGATKGSGTDFLDGIWAQDVPFPSFSAGWTRPLINTRGTHGPCFAYMFAPGMYAQNNPAVPFYVGRYNSDAPYNDPTYGPVSPSYYADADGVVRRASGAYVPVGTNISASSPVGLPTTGVQGYPLKPASLITPASKGAATDPGSFAQSQSRPLLLHRPFRNVAELGYVFRDLPWKNLDFFTPESGDAALLDLFCINETSDPNGLVAGKVDLNTRQAPVLAAIAAGACVDDPKITNTTIGSLSSTLANTVATNLTARTSDTTPDYGPLQNVSELVGKWNAAVACAPPTGVTYTPVVASANCGIDLASPNYTDGKLSYIGFSGNTVDTSGKDLSSVFTPASAGSLTESLAYIKRLREAPIRALANVGQTRVWNLMIDVVAQTGRYPKSANALDKFVVEGEQRYWVHLAIDRYTGQVLDKQIEVVKE